MYNYEKRILKKELGQIYSELENGHQRQEQIVKTLANIEDKLEKNNQLLESIDAHVCKVGNMTEEKIDNTYLQLKDMLIELYKIENRNHTNVVDSLTGFSEENKKSLAEVVALLKTVLVNLVLDDMEKITAPKLI